MKVATERLIGYEYGPPLVEGGLCFEGAVSGEYTWEQLHERIRDERYGGDYNVVSRHERVVSYGDWVDVDAKPEANVFHEAADLLRRWNVEEGKLGQFDRGLHLLGHLARGGTLEEYGEPDV